MDKTILKALENLKQYKPKKIEFVMNKYAINVIDNETIGELVKEGVIITTDENIMPDWILREYKDINKAIDTIKFHITYDVPKDKNVNYRYIDISWEEFDEFRDAVITLIDEYQRLKGENQ